MGGHPDPVSAELSNSASHGPVVTRQYTFVQHPFELSPCRCYLSPAVEPLHPGGSTLTPLPHMRRGEGPRSSAGKEHGWVFGRIRGTL